MKTLQERLGIRKAEFCRFPYENSDERVPVLLIEFEDMRPTQPVIEDFCDFLKENYPSSTFPEPGQIRDVAASYVSDNPTTHYVIHPKPELFRIQMTCKPKLDSNMKIWLFETPYGHIELPVSREELINRYIERLKQQL